MIRDIIAKRYARAFFAYAEEQGKLAPALTELRRVADLVAASEELESVLSNPVFEAAERRSVLNELLKRLEIGREVTVFLDILVDKNKFRYLASIVKRLEGMVDEAEGRLQVEVVSAVELDQTVLGQLRERLAAVTARNVRLAVTVDESLIGGLITRFAGMVYDGSVRTQLRNLEEQLVKEW
ncbi:MAG: ATP synthase F1 subunit delta [Deltaproteobacteria bacterium]|nr:ATP synthase F1 subunit delta [Candidatus Anaeroferrophillacea bacterium]